MAIVTRLIKKDSLLGADLKGYHPVRVVQLKKYSKCIKTTRTGYMV